METMISMGEVGAEIQGIAGGVAKKSTIPSKKYKKNGYTGIKEDRPGPEVYNPSLTLIKSKS